MSEFPLSLTSFKLPEPVCGLYNGQLVTAIVNDLAYFTTDISSNGGYAQDLVLSKTKAWGAHSDKIIQNKEDKHRLNLLKGSILTPEN